MCGWLHARDEVMITTTGGLAAQYKVTELHTIDTIVLIATAGNVEG